MFAFHSHKLPEAKQMIPCLAAFNKTMKNMTNHNTAFVIKSIWQVNETECVTGIKLMLTQTERNIYLL